ncbi:hypothetical protein AM587_10003184 [Phytophthora nicotianae]|uniref:Uncharacterized protein n=1 Tax=Phytophthora nicotianae TaxID=4792 RepID=A0A0W8CT10_PHYNI|nr:hypothetical protein AM587_10003184 [Phytophthora nicotianae]
MVKNRFRDAFGYYNAVRKVLSKQNKSEKLDNELTPEEEKKYISYEELMSVPQKVKKILMDTYGEVFLSNNELSKLTKAKSLAYLRLVFDYVTLYLNVHYPLRLVWPTVYLRPVDAGNYLQGTKLHLNNFKNVRLMGAQVIDLDGSTINLIAQFLHFLINSLGQTPTKLLWRVYNNSPGEYDSNNGFSSTLSKLFVKYNGKPMSMNMIRHIVESHLIQSPTYAKLTNREKHDLHAKLLHSTFAANTSYNKIANRSTAPEVSEEAPDFSYEPTPQPPSPALKHVGNTYSMEISLQQAVINHLKLKYSRSNMNPLNIKSKSHPNDVQTGSTCYEFQWIARASTKRKNTCKSEDYARLSCVR